MRARAQVSFAFGTHALPPCLRLSPPRGVVPPKSHALVALRYAPEASPSLLALTLPLTFNHSPANAGALRVRGEAAAPLLTTSLAPGGGLFLRPTCVGSVSESSFEVVNAGRAPARWRLDVSRRLAGVVAAAPRGGLLAGGESCEVAVSFAPAAAQRYEGRAALLLLPPGAAQGEEQEGEQEVDTGATGPAGPTTGSGNGGAAEAAEAAGVAAAAAAGKVILSIVGEGTPGALSVEPAAAHFGALRVGYPASRTLTLVNHSDGLLRYRVSVAASSSAGSSCRWAAEGGAGAGAAGGEGAAAPAPAVGDARLLAAMAEAAADADAAAALVVFEEAGLGAAGGGGTTTATARCAGGTDGEAAECWVSEAEGVIGGRSQKLLTVTLLPWRRARYRLRLVVSDGGGCGAGGAPLAAPCPLAAVDLTADVSFPCVLVTDAAADGAPKPVLWQQLGLPALNAALAGPVTRLELRAAGLAARGALTTDSAAALLPPLVVDLGALAAGGGAREIALRLFNPGALPAAWELHSYDNPQVGCCGRGVCVGRPPPHTAGHCDLLVLAMLLGECTGPPLARSWSLKTGWRAASR